MQQGTESSERARGRASARSTLGLFVVVAAGLLAALFMVGGAGMASALESGELGRAALVLLAALGVFALAARLALWLRYRPLQASRLERAQLPELTVVIPAYNEGPMVRRSIESVLASDYPAERLRVIVVNDGSRDDTGAHIDAAAAAHPGRVEALHLAANRGKRHALYEGFCRATTPFVATVDSDSLVPPESLANIVLPLLRDRRVGGVAGKVEVHNRRENLITRMLGVRYILGFDFVRAYQSELRTVWCCPGALQAYRLSLIRPHLGAWRDQTFLGAQCTNGDDHAMTNLVLGLGADTVYQSNAVVRTLVPSTYAKLCKMYVRWGRSATREGLRALRFAPRRALAKGPLAGPLLLLDAVLQPLTIALRVLGLFAAAAVLIAHPAAVLNAALATTLSAVLYSLIFLRSERSSEVIFGVLYAYFALFALPWVQPFATLTVRRNGWMTRD